jgi:hypothetical protein
MLIDQEDDIAADVKATMDAFQGAPEPAPEPQAEEAPEASQDGAQRDEQGRFAKKEETEQNAPASPEEGAEPQAEKQETIRPPASWSAAAKAVFDKLDPVVQQEVLKREKDIETGKAQWDAKGEKLNKFEALIAPRREKLALAGVDEFTAIQQLLAAQDFLERDPRGALQYLAQQYGVQLPGVGGPQAQQFQQPANDPNLTALQNQVAQLSQTLNQRQQQDEEAERARHRSEIEAFAANPANLYFENVKADMANLISVGQATGLQDAYEKAIWANPEIRPLLIAAAAPKPQAEPKVVGKPAGLSVTGARAPGASQANGSTNPNASIEDDIRDAIAQVQGRA